METDTLKFRFNGRFARLQRLGASEGLHGRARLDKGREGGRERGREGGREDE